MYMYSTHVHVIYMYIDLQLYTKPIRQELQVQIIVKVIL